jgi:hypothetical protein
MGSVALRLQHKSLSAREHHCPLLPITHNVVDGTLYTTYKEKWATTVFEEGVSLWNLAVLALVRPHWF